MTRDRRNEIASAVVALVSVTAVFAIALATLMTAPALGPERDPRAATAAAKGPAPTWGTGGDIDR